MRWSKSWCVCVCVGCYGQLTVSPSFVNFHWSIESNFFSQILKRNVYLHPLKLCTKFDVDTVKIQKVDVTSPVFTLY